MLPSENQLKKLTEITNGDRAQAEDRQEDIIHLGVATLAAFCYTPLNVHSHTHLHKQKMSNLISTKLVNIVNKKFTDNWLLFIKHPSSSINVIKALYSMCLVDQNMCLFISKNSHLKSLFEILSDKVNLYFLFNVFVSLLELYSAFFSLFQHFPAVLAFSSFVQLCLAFSSFIPLF
jgi:hypothetical protein